MLYREVGTVVCKRMEAFGDWKHGQSDIQEHGGLGTGYVRVKRKGAPASSMVFRYAKAYTGNILS